MRISGLSSHLLCKCSVDGRPSTITPSKYVESNSDLSVFDHVQLPCRCSRQIDDGAFPAVLTIRTAINRRALQCQMESDDARATASNLRVLWTLLGWVK